MRATIFDLLDNFLKPRQYDVRTMPGTALVALGEEVRRFAASDREGLEPSRQGVYLGGWPSANFWAVGGDLLLTSLLYSEQLLVRDPIMDWFSNEQYKVPHKMASRPGHLDGDGQPNILRTRAFLAHVLPSLDRWRPLVEAGIVVTVPAEQAALRHETKLQELTDELAARLLADPVEYAREFDPVEVAVEHNLRGMFVFAGGDREAQLRKAQTDGVRYFAGEYLLAETNGATYTAPFHHEQHLCRGGLGAALRPRERVIEAMLRSRLPVFAGLDPSVIRSIHDDESFASFRSELHVVYSNLPAGRDDEQIAAYLDDQEQALLTPALRLAEREVSRGTLGKMGVQLTENVFALAGGIASGIVSRDPAVAIATGALGELVDAVRRRNASVSAQPIWQELVKHHRAVKDEMVAVQSMPATDPDAFWGIAEEPSMQMTVSAGEAIWDSIPEPGLLADASAQAGSYSEGVYRLCECGSGRKYKFCCLGVR